MAIVTHRPRVFISYQRSDEVFAGLVREHLVAHDVLTWMDQFDIPVGAYWPDEIDTGLGGGGHRRRHPQPRFGREPQR